MAITFNGYFPTGARFGDYYAVEYDSGGDFPSIDEGHPGRYEYALDPAGSGETVAKITATRGSFFGTPPQRVELRPHERNFGDVGPPEYGEEFSAIQLYWPSDGGWTGLERANGVNADAYDDHGIALPSARHIISQHHIWPEVGETGFPDVALMIWRGYLWAHFTYDTNAVTASDNQVPNLYHFERLYAQPLNSWTLIVQHLKASCDNTGFYHLSINRRRILTLDSIPTMWNNPLGPYLKCGNYAFSYVGEGPITQVHYTKGIVIGDDASSHLEVSGVTELGASLAISGRGRQ